MKPLDLIGCGALNLDLIYRLPRTFSLWEELGPPGTEQLLDAAVRRAVEESLAHVAPARSGGGQAANTANAINVRDSMFIHGDYGMDYVIVSFETAEDKQKVKRLKNLTCNTKGRGGIHQFKAKFSEPNEV